MNTSQRKEAEKLLHQGNWQAALQTFLEIVNNESSPDPEILNIIGMLQAKIGKYEEALISINHALQLKSNYPPFYNNKGNILLHLNQIDAAISAYQQSIKIQPKYPIGYSNLGRCYYLQNKLIASKKAFEQALQLDAGLTDANYNYAVLLIKLGKYPKALNLLKKTLDLNPRYAPAQGQIAQIYLQQQDYDKAIFHLSKRIEIQPSHVDSWFHLGLCHLELNQFTPAKQALEKTVSLEPNHIEAYHYLGTVHLQLGDREKALNYFLRQIEIQSNSSTYYNIGVLLMYLERHAEAIEYLKLAQETEPGYLPIHLNLGSIYLKLGAVPEAINHYQLANKIKPNDPEIMHILNALTQTKTPEKAPTEYLQHLFDQYASHYDKHLTEYLHYRVPQQLHKLIYQEIEPPEEKWKVLDLGCGTGLCGELFKEFADELIGIDLSTEMIEAARRKKIYDHLIVGDISEKMINFQQIDLILAADVFTYLGDLENLFDKASLILKEGGLFAFSVEKGGPEPYKLQQSIRYAHARDYLEQLIHQYQFTNLRFDNIMLRKQKGHPVEGYLVLLQKGITVNC